MPARFTVCVLCYGDYPDLASRLFTSLGSSAAAPADFELRIGLNAISDKTAAIVKGVVAKRNKRNLITHIYQDDSTTFKYPRMRQMFHTHKIVTPYVMWFDDDSCIAPDARPQWFNRVHNAMHNADMVGKIYYMDYRGGQREAMMQMPWYTGRDIAKIGKYKVGRVIFITGGWWAIRTEILVRYDWPPVCLEHTGGDTMLGELFRQQGLQLRQFIDEVWWNADSNGKTDASSRRGFDQKPYGVDFNNRVVNND